MIPLPYDLSLPSCTDQLSSEKSPVVRDAYLSDLAIRRRAMSFSAAGGLYRRSSSHVSLAVACPTPNLGSGAHAAGIIEAKGAPALGMLGSTPSGRAQGSVSPAAAAETKEEL